MKSLIAWIFEPLPHMNAGRARAAAWVVVIAFTAALLLVGKCTVDMIGGA